MGLAGRWVLGHSIAGAIAGGVIAVEAFKLVFGIRGSTGAQFVAPLATGIAVGRLGCFFAGLPDFTYGTPTALPWGVDFGDGIARHPVQLYESAAMLLFLIVYLREIARGSELFRARVSISSSAGMLASVSSGNSSNPIPRSSVRSISSTSSVRFFWPIRFSC